MTNKLWLGIACVAMALSGFGAGYWWKGTRLGALPRFTLTRPLEIQASPTDKGILPAGIVLYKYRDLPETITYIVFVNSENRDVLTPISQGDLGPVISPVNASLLEAAR